MISNDSNPHIQFSSLQTRDQAMQRRTKGRFQQWRYMEQGLADNEDFPVIRPDIRPEATMSETLVKSFFTGYPIGNKQL